jgi:hypothetical protein
MKIPKQSPLKQIRKQCLECCGNDLKTIRFCHSTDCPLWLFRFGKYSIRVIRENGKNNQALFDKNNFKINGKFCPNITVSKYEL